MQMSLPEWRTMLTMQILLVEDEVALGRLVSQGLELAGYQVTWCRDGLEGFEKALEGGWAVILLDIMLPGLDGWGICRRREAAAFG